MAQVKTIRRALKLSQEEFAASFHIPIGDASGLGARSEGAGRGGARLSARECPRAGRGAQGARTIAAALIGTPHFKGFLLDAMRFPNFAVLRQRLFGDARISPGKRQLRPLDVILRNV